MSRYPGFGEREFSVTPVRGTRRFSVDALGRLVGMRDRVWLPGENVAECLLGRDHDGFEEEGSPATDPRHCECGFYAYAEGVESHPARERGRFAYGVVEGYGLVSVGSKGFKAQRARIVGLVVEPRRRPSRLAHALARASERDLASVGSWLAAVFVGFVSAVLALTGGAPGITETYPFSLAPAWVPTVVLAVIAVTSLGRAAARVAFGEYHPDSCSVCITNGGGEDPRSRVAENYPDVPVFATVEELLAEFPPDPAPSAPADSVTSPASSSPTGPEVEADADRPVDPRPSTDPGFWTRPARPSR